MRATINGKRVTDKESLFRLLRENIPQINLPYNANILLPLTLRQQQEFV